MSDDHPLITEMIFWKFQLFCIKMQVFPKYSTLVPPVYELLNIANQFLIDVGIIKHWVFHSDPGKCCLILFNMNAVIVNVGCLLIWVFLS